MRAILSCWALLLLPACGGGSPGVPAESAADTSTSSPEARPRASTAATDANDDGPGPEVSKGPRCDDGTCSTCGSGICPAGWYCDEKGGGACSWLAECAQKPTCGCITRVLGAGCKCEATGGGLKVACE